MKKIGFGFIFLLTVVYSCGQRNLKNGDISLKVKMNDSAVSLMRYNDKDSSLKAISFLNRATSIDSNYYLAYWNKFIFIIGMQQYNDAIEVVNNLIRIQPMSPDLNLMKGILYVKTNNNVVAIKYFNDALSMYNSTLDTMSINNIYYNILAINRGITIILTGDSVKGNDILQKIYESPNKEKDTLFVKDLLNKTKEQIVDYLINGYKSVGIPAS